MLESLFANSSNDVKPKRALKILDLLVNSAAFIEKANAKEEADKKSSRMMSYLKKFKRIANIFSRQIN